MSAAPSWPLVIVALFRGDTSEVRLPPSRVEFRSISRAEDRFQGHFGPDFVLQTFKTQNDARGDLHRSARQNHLIADCKSPKLPVSQRLAEEYSPLLLPVVLSCCRPDMGRRSWRFEG